MVKPIQILKEKAFPKEFTDLVENLIGHIPSVRVKPAQSAKTGSRLVEAPDLVLTVTKDRKPTTLIVECKTSAQPRDIRGTIAQLKQYSQLLPEKRKYAVVLAPYISPESARIIEEAGVGYADLSGNARLSFDGIYIETHGHENAFKRPKEARSLFSSKGQRVLRVLLQGPIRSCKVSELAAKAQVSLGWASALKQQLLAREWAVDEKGAVRLTDPGALLNAWAAADEWAKRTEVRQYSLLETEPVDIAAFLAKALEKEVFAFTQWFAGWLRQPYTLPPIVTAYVKQWPGEEALQKALGARRVSQGGRLWLAKPKDEGVFTPGQSVKGFSLVSDVQIYLDLLRAGQRGDEQAAALRKLKTFSGGWS